MKTWFLGKRGGMVTFLAIAMLVAGGLAWLTSAALQLEAKEHQARAEAELSGRLRLALWRLDSRVFPLLARESSRPYYHYTPTYVPPLAYTWSGKDWEQAKVVEPSPLLSEPLPDWILLHFQIDEAGRWQSPEAPSVVERQRLEASKSAPLLDNVTSERSTQFEQLQKRVAATELMARVEQRSNQLFLSLGPQFNLQASNQFLLNRNNNNDAVQPGQAGVDPQAPNQPPAVSRQSVDQDVQARQTQRAQLEPNYGNSAGRVGPNKKQPEPGKEAARPPVEAVPVAQGLTAPLWIHSGGEPPLLITARLVQVGPKVYCQGVLLDWPHVREVLMEEVKDLFPHGDVRPIYDDKPAHPELTMTALPLEFGPGEDADVPPLTRWTPLRIGLAFVWGAALVALIAVAFGGWSLIDLSERRIRFVSAVTHELRTPLTTLRLYLDMLTGGMVKDEAKKTEYLHTLNAESERLNRLIGNVLDFSRLENQKPQLEHTQVVVRDLLEQVRSTWAERCKDAGKELVIDSTLGDALVTTDTRMVQQILGNLIENACKYSRGADDPHIWLRARFEQSKGVVLEIEDHGPGVPVRDRRLVFRPFRRGRSTDPALGGVGLGLALAQRWAQLLGGDLILRPPDPPSGACFQLHLPMR
jgi:signal transduction histidine kinase